MAARALGLVSLLALLVFTACSSTTSSDDDFDDEEEESSSSLASSSSTSSSSGSDSTATSSSSATNKSLASPSGLSYTQLSTTQWILTWSYTQAEKAPESGFIVQYLDLETSEWIEAGRSNAEVYHYLLSGEKYGGYYYRVCAYDDDGTSSWTSEVYITAATTSTDTTEVGLATPTSLSYSQMSSTSWMLTWSYTQDEVEESGFIVQRLDVDASKWVEVGRSNAEVYHYLLEGEEYSGYYYRVCAYNDDGNSSWSGEVYIAATTTADDVAELASPTSLSATQSTSTSWTLTWSYSQEADAPETGFIIQQLGLLTGEWVEVGRSNAEVYHYLLNGEEYSGYYYRVAAYDESDTSDWTSEVYIEPTATSEDEAVLASPTTLASAQLSTTRWILTWGYTQEENAPETGFVIQQLDLATSAWVAVGNASAEVYHFLLSGENYAGHYYRVAAYDESDTSGYSSELYVEATTTSTAPGLASPTSLTNAGYLNYSWVLTWEYTQNEDYPETGFIIQKLDWDEGDWVEVARTVTGVYHYLLNSSDYAGYYYRVCAYNDEGYSLWSEETFISALELDE